MVVTGVVGEKGCTGGEGGFIYGIQDFGNYFLDPIIITLFHRVSPFIFFSSQKQTKAQQDKAQLYYTKGKKKQTETKGPKQAGQTKLACYEPKAHRLKPAEKEQDTSLTTPSNQ